MPSMTSAPANNSSNNCIYCSTWQFSSVFFPPPLSLAALACVWKLHRGGNKVDICLTPGVSDPRATPTTTAAGDLTLSINTPVCTCTRGENTPKWQATAKRKKRKKPLFLPLTAPAKAGRETQASQGEKKVFLHLFPRLKALIKRLLNSSTSSPPRPASCQHFFSFHFFPLFHSRHLVFDGPCLGERSRLVGGSLEIYSQLSSISQEQCANLCCDMKGCFAQALFQEIKCNKNNG